MDCSGSFLRVQDRNHKMYTKTVSITLVIVICVFLGLYGLVGILQSGMFQCRPSQPCWSDSKAGGAGAAGLQNTRSYVELEEYKKCAGDSPTRKGVFDCLVSGTIPVIFDENTIYQQYMEYLPKKGRSYSVLFDGHAVLDGKIDVLEELHRIPTNTIAAMQRTINGLLPNIIYSKPGSNVSTRDAFDITIDSLLHRFRVQS
ncbi:unnamed protein product [Sphagnum jensenii]|uniref:Uncharacterized protein n=1 Tax=Sphagnum jensenii TaxID=128206 RepID=A0ABP0WYX9_9BRYO